MTDRKNDFATPSRREALMLGFGALGAGALAGSGLGAGMLPRRAAAAAATAALNVAYAGAGATLAPFGGGAGGETRVRAFLADDPAGAPVLDVVQEAGAPVPLPQTPGAAWRYALGDGAPTEEAVLSAPVQGPQPEAIGILASRPTAIAGQGVHFELNPADLSAPAARAGLSPEVFMRRAFCVWRFSENPAENYEFTRLAPDKYGRRHAGGAIGPFAGHVYETLGRHAVSCTVTLGAQVWVARGEVEVTRDRDAVYARATALCDPQGAFDDYAGPTRPAGLFTDVDEALAWLQAKPGRRLMLRRGRDYPINGTRRGPGQSDGYAMTEGACLEAWGEGDAPVLSLGAGWRNYLPDVEAVADGRTLGFPARSKVGADAEILAYVDGKRRRDMRLTRGSVVFDAPPPAGAQVLAFAAGRRGALPQKTSRMIAITGPDAILRGIAFRGAYDPARPGVFDGEDLSSYEHAPIVVAVEFRSPKADRVTIFDCAARGLRGFVSATYAGDADVIANCAVSDWSNYGIYLNDARRLVVVGCDVAQTQAAATGGGGKSMNAIGRPNDADHGPLRTPESFSQVINACRFGSYNSWAGNDWQPIVRMATTNAGGMSYSFSECDCRGGSGYIPAGAPNPWIPQRRQGLIWSGANRFVAGRLTGSLSGAMTPFVSHSDLLVIADAGAESDFAIVRGASIAPGLVEDAVEDPLADPEAEDEDEDEGAPGGGDDGDGEDDGDGDGMFEDFAGTGYVTSPDFDVSPPLLINLTVVADGTRPGGALNLSRPRVAQGVGVLCRVGDAVVARDAPEIDILNVARAPYSKWGWHLWVQPAGAPESEARAAKTVSEQAALYAFSHQPNELKGKRGALRVRALRGGFSAGERLILARTPVADDGETFLPNNLAAPLVRAAPVYENLLLLMPGAWKGVEREVGAPLIPSEALRPGRYGDFDAFWRPQAGNAALGAASPGADAVDGTGFVRPVPGALGALERRSDPGAAAPAPVGPPLAPVSGEWTGAPLRSGAALGPGAVRIGAVGDGPAPNLLFTLRRDGITRRAASAPVPAAGDLVGAEILRSGPLAGRVSTRLPWRRVPGAPWRPDWIRAESGIFWRADAEHDVGEGLHFACRLRLRPPGDVAGASNGWRGVLLQARGLSITVGASDAATGEAEIQTGAVTERLSLTPGAPHALLVSRSAGELRCRLDGIEVLRTPVKGAPPPQRYARLLSQRGRDGQAAVDLSDWIGLWAGPAPAPEALFAPDGAARDVLLDPSLGAGLRPLLLFSGLESFRDRLNLAGQAGWVKTYGNRFAVI